MKKIVAKIEMKKDFIELLESYYEDYRAKQDLLVTMFDIHKNDDDDSFISSKPFLGYEKRFMESKIKYDTLMREIRENYIEEKWATSKYNFEVNFEENLIEIYEMI